MAAKWKPQRKAYGEGYQLIKVNEKNIATEVGGVFYASKEEAQFVADKLNGEENGY